MMTNAVQNGFVVLPAKYVYIVCVFRTDAVYVYSVILNSAVHN